MTPRMNASDVIRIGRTRIRADRLRVLAAAQQSIKNGGQVRSVGNVQQNAV